jgi:hypothetical protein
MPMLKKKDVINDEVVALGAWCRAVIQFLSAHSPQDKKMYAQFDEAIDRGTAGGSLPGMRDAARLLSEMASELPPRVLDDLDKDLVSKFGKGLRSAASARVKRLQWILQHGRIENEQDHELLVGRVGEIFQDPQKQDELEAINALVAKYGGTAADST